MNITDALIKIELATPDEDMPLTEEERRACAVKISMLAEMHSIASMLEFTADLAGRKTHAAEYASLKILIQQAVDANVRAIVESRGSELKPGVSASLVLN